MRVAGAPPNVMVTARAIVAIFETIGAISNAEARCGIPISMKRRGPRINLALEAYGVNIAGCIQPRHAIIKRALRTTSANFVPHRFEKNGKSFSKHTNMGHTRDARTAGEQKEDCSASSLPSLPYDESEFNDSPRNYAKS